MGKCNIKAKGMTEAYNYKRMLEKNGIKAEISKMTLPSGCVFVVSYDCVYDEKVGRLVKK